ncbi:response regulator [Allochromatium vinosum]|uniref:Response regulator receiver protein n=1 Tax=Allochromatium vinosum (strain ATCC 17899 / DSM 180 / NBRC 103801 / NCIMB 10441 / D) TaxID=572477 RepID=D3RNQ9_ALLVD|nr:response regulator [Allochromatium vinosum]ADC63424.1 response regulator receiver protein [Allochromatium vinosum DSM 180]MBK1654006.1 response regulator [Allochromatium vinosum]
MPTEFELIRVEPADIDLDRALTYDVFRADGSLLAAAGTRIDDPWKIEILMDGWRRAPAVVSDALNLDSPPPVTPVRIARPQPAAVRPINLAQTTALVADDMPLARAMLSNILLAQGIGRVIVVEDGKKAISRFLADAPNLVLLDIDMPKLDGLEALRQIKECSPGVFACLVSSNSTRVNVQLAREFGVDGFLVKPYTPLNLKRILARYRAHSPKGPH